MTSVDAGQVGGIERRRNQSKLWRHWGAMVSLIAADMLAFASGYYLFRHGVNMPAVMLPSTGNLPDFASATDIYLVIGAVFVLTRYVLGDYTRRQLFWDGVRSTVSTLTVMAVPDILLVALVNSGQLYWYLISSWLFVLVAVPAYRQLARHLMSLLGIWQIPTTLIGTGRKACNAYSGLRGALSLGFDIRYLLVSNDQVAVPGSLEKLQRLQLSDSESVANTLRHHGCTQIIVSAEDAREQQISEMIRGLIGTEISIAIIPSLTGLPLFGLSTNYLFGQDLLLLQLRNNLARVPSRIIKRIVDLIGPIAIILLSSPIWLFIIAAIKLYDGGPVFYWQPRVGRDGRMFNCIKFRTMAGDADERLEKWRIENPNLYAEFLKSFKLRDDPRVTKPGKWIRRTSLDELPQLLNVLAGSMSLVGPRPVPLAQLREQYGQSAQLYLQVRPGLTGLWQVSGRSDTSGDQRVFYDEWYILNWSVWYDFVILIQTVWIVITARGAY